MRKYIYWLFPLIWMGIIFYSSSQPYEKQTVKPFLANELDLSFLIPYLDWVSFTFHHSVVSIETLGIEGFIEFFIRKGAHITVFFVLLCLFFAALKKSVNILFKFKLIISFFLTVAYAGIDEYNQGFTDNRTAYSGDVVIDSFGALIAVVLIIAIRFQVNGSKKRLQNSDKFV